jgi:hypothetical protein
MLKATGLTDARRRVGGIRTTPARRRPCRATGTTSGSTRLRPTRTGARTTAGRASGRQKWATMIDRRPTMSAGGSSSGSMRVTATATATATAAAATGSTGNHRRAAGGAGAAATATLMFLRPLDVRQTATGVARRSKGGRALPLVSCFSLHGVRALTPL